jgi:hypothetical protein
MCTFLITFFLGFAVILEIIAIIQRVKAKQRDKKWEAEITVLLKKNNKDLDEIVDCMNLWKS